MVKIGKRTIKTAIAVGLALFVKIVLVLAIDLPTGQPWSKLFYTPFFGAIAAAYSMHANMNASKNQAKIRTMGSLVGGFYGIAILIIIETLFAFVFKISTDDWLYYLIDYTVVALAIIPMIHITVVTKKTYATWIACLTYLSVTVSIRNDFDDQLKGFFSNSEVLNAYIIAIIFALNRILSTIIGVCISLGVNLFHFNFQCKNKDVLFCVGIEGVVTGDKEKMAGFMSYQLNHMCEVGANVTLFTTRVPRAFMHLFTNVNINNPVVCMSGAALYDPKKLTYLDKEEIPFETCKRIDEILSTAEVNPFKNYIIDDVLYVYTESIDNLGEELMAKRVRNDGYGNFVMGKCPYEMGAVFYLMIDTREKASLVMKKLEDLNDKVIVQIYDVFDEDSSLVPDLVYIKIYSKEVLKLNVLHRYAKEKNYRIAGLTTSKLSNHLLDNSEIKVSSITDSSEDTIKITNYEDMFKELSNIYYNKKYKVESQVKSNE